MAPGPGRDAGLSLLSDRQLAGALDHPGGGDRLSLLGSLRLALSMDTAGSAARAGGRAFATRGARVSPEFDRWIMAMLAMAVILLLTDKFVLREKAGQTTAIVEKSIAVLPLINSTGDPANEYFSDGMSEEFISSLARLPDLKVVGRTSSFQFKGKTEDSKRSAKSSASPICSKAACDQSLVHQARPRPSPGTCDSPSLFHSRRRSADAKPVQLGSGQRRCRYGPSEDLSSATRARSRQ